MSSLPLISPVPLQGGDTADLVIMAIVVGIWIIASVVQVIQRALKRTRQRLRGMAEGQQPMRLDQTSPPAPAPLSSRRPTPTVPVAAGADPPPERDLVSDLETILRDQLGLDFGPRRPERPAAPSAPTPPVARPVRPSRRAVARRPVEAPAMVAPAPPPAPPPEVRPRAPGREPLSYEERVRARPSGAASLRQLLMSTGGLRTAVLAREILGPPLAERDWP